MEMLKNVLTAIATEGSTNKKMDILSANSSNPILKKAIYLAESKRVKFYIKQIPEYTSKELKYTIEQALEMLNPISSRTLTGGEAIAHLTDILQHTHSDDAYVIKRIIEKDLKIGMGSTNINKVYGKDFIEKTPYMGAKAYEEDLAKDIVKAKSGAVSQVKMDGRYCNAIVSGVVKLESRGGEPSFLEGAKFLEELKTIDESIVLNGELTMDGVSRYESNGIIASCISIGKKIEDGENIEKELKKFSEKHNMTFQEALDKIVYTVWDCITTDEYADNKSSVKYINRFATVDTLLKTYNLTMVRLIKSTFVKTYEEAVLAFQKALNEGEEGTILKSLDGAWKDGKPNWQVKMKLEMDIDMKIVGFNYGKAGTKNENVISSLTVQSSCGKVETRPAGISEDDMDFITKNMDKLLNTIVEVKCSGLSQDREGNYALLHPVFNKFRDDKSTCDTLEDIIKIENMKKGLV